MGLQDHDRTLTEEGRRVAALCAEALAKANWLPELILCRYMCALCARTTTNPHHTPVH